MAQTSQKNDREKKKKQKKKEKEERKALRKANSNKGKGLEGMMAYVDHNGQLSDTPPDPKFKVEIKVEDIQLGARSLMKEELNTPKMGRISIYNNERKFGFIKDSLSQEKIFFHISDTEGDVKEGDIVSYETVRGPKGISAVNVIKQNPKS